MRKSLLILSAGFLFITGCKEIGPDIGIMKAITINADTSYILSSIPLVDPHNVLVEDFTGQSCPACPAADINLESQVKNNPNPAIPNVSLINVISMFIPGPTQTNDPTGSKHDLRDSTALELANENSIYVGLTGLPNVGVDRVSCHGSSGPWDNAISNQIKMNDSLNLLVQSNYTAAVVTTTVSVTYTQPILYAQNINIAIVEDSIVDVHEVNHIPPHVSGYDSSYLYMNVFRGYVTSGISGDLIYPKTPSKKPQGLYCRRVYTYTLPKVLTNSIYNNPAIVPNHCRVIAFVTNSTNGSIAQSAQTPLMGQ